MHLLFFIIFLFANYPSTHASTLEEHFKAPKLTVKHLKLHDLRWDSSIFTRRTDTENPDTMRLSYLNLDPSQAMLTIEGSLYQLVYLEAALPKDRYNTKATFPAFFKKHSVTNLKYDPFPNFRVLSKLVAQNPTARLCDTLSYYEYFPESDESYTITFMKQTDLAGFQSGS